MKKSLAATVSSQKMDWLTPPEFIERVKKMGPIALDPCAPQPPHESFVAPFKEFTERGLERPWGEWKSRGLVFVNPPYGRAIEQWMAKCATESREGVEIVALIPSRTDSRWFRSSVFESASAVCYYTGRIVFWDPETRGPVLDAKGRPTSAPFPCAVVYYGNRVSLFAKTFGGARGVVHDLRSVSV